MTAGNDFLRLVYGAPRQFKTRPHIWHHYLNFVEHGDVCLEFGVWNGHSINTMAAICPDNQFHGFDSFEGLPEEWTRDPSSPNSHPKGHFATDLQKLKVWGNVTLHKGWFKDSLPGWLERYATLRPRIKCIHIDCDLGSSTRDVLTLLEEDIISNKAVLLFDEFYNYPGFQDHEIAAFVEFLNRTGADFEVIGRNAQHEQVLIQIK